MKYHDETTFASDAIQIELDLEKLDFLMPEICSPIQKLKYRLRNWGMSSYIERVAEHISFGDSQGAIVIKTKPLLIAAYNEDIDCIVMLRFEDKVQNRYNFAEKDRLICVNTFGQVDELQSDLIPGEDNSRTWTMVYPIVVNLVSKSEKEIERRKNEIGDKGYQYIWKLSNEYLNLKQGVFRDGRPFYSAVVI